MFKHDCDGFSNRIQCRILTNADITHKPILIEWRQIVNKARASGPHVAQYGGARMCVKLRWQEYEKKSFIKSA
ncbi:Hypothetical predicted protein [Octopus vulgaris]|uniref:Uncharacterized protein n=1 Tax=Octopus vulgaris TaxID=6645 RepID=A0AA36EXE8_OCTVU|nr:Hypothetical predicted protein [Octopus vulgaris]